MSRLFKMHSNAYMVITPIKARHRYAMKSQLELYFLKSNKGVGGIV